MECHHCQRLQMQIDQAKEYLQYLLHLKQEMSIRHTYQNHAVAQTVPVVAHPVYHTQNYHGIPLVPGNVNDNWADIVENKERLEKERLEKNIEISSELKFIHAESQTDN